MNREPSSTLDQDELEKAVVAIIVRVLMVEPEMVTPDAELVMDLGAESIDFLDLLFQLEDLVGRRVPPEEWEAWVTARLPDPRLGKGITVRIIQEFARNCAAEA